MVKSKYPKLAKTFHGKLPPEITDIIGMYVRRAVRQTINQMASRLRRARMRADAPRINRRLYIRRAGTRGPYARRR